MGGGSDSDGGNPLDLTPIDGGTARGRKRQPEPEPEVPEPVEEAPAEDRPLLGGCRHVDREYNKLNKIDEGAYGVVWRAEVKKTKTIVALKQIKLEKFPDGFPKSALREITVLQGLQHENIVQVLEMVVGKRQDDIFMVMEYMEHELKTLLWDMAEGKRAHFSLSEVKSLMYQLTDAVSYMHACFILHRDLKSSNILFNNEGCLKICDFGLARKFGDPSPTDYLTHRVSPYTGLVVTLWYRSPELILGWKAPEPNVRPYELNYGAAVDVWSCGCIFGELLILKPLFFGERHEVDHLLAIFALTGTPNETSWPGCKDMPLWPQLVGQAGFKRNAPSWREKFATAAKGAAIARGVTLSDHGLELMRGLLACNPDNRISARDALKSPWFTEAPARAPPGSLSKWADSNSVTHSARRRIRSDERYNAEAGGEHKEGAALGVCVNPSKFLEQLQEVQVEEKRVKEDVKKLPPGWIERKSNSTGKVFFINLKTKQTQWTKPTAPA